MLPCVTAKLWADTTIDLPKSDARSVTGDSGPEGDVILAQNRRRDVVFMAVSRFPSGLLPCRKCPEPDCQRLSAFMPAGMSTLSAMLCSAHTSGARNGFVGGNLHSISSDEWCHQPCRLDSRTQRQVQTVRYLQPCTAYHLSGVTLAFQIR